jgi:hypothetical protein
VRGNKQQEGGEMRSKQWLAILALGLGAAGVMAAEMVGIRGSRTQYVTEIDTTVDGKEVHMMLTGTALRTRFIVNVYTVGSYLKAGTEIKTPEDLAAADIPKRLHLIMERDVAGPDMAEAIKNSIRANYPEPAFNDELSNFLEQLKTMNLKKGDHVLLTHVPGVGLTANVAGKHDFIIKNPKFTKAVWDIYLGKKNLGDDIKTSLTSRL